MAWNGYFEFDGMEIINVARTQANAQARGAHWVLDTFSGSVDLAPLVGDGYYTSPDGGTGGDFAFDTDSQPYVLDDPEGVSTDADDQLYLNTNAGPDTGVQYDDDGVPYLLLGGSVAPWYSADEPESGDFLGIIPGPNGVQGIEASTRQAVTTEFTIDGGFTAPARSATKGLVFDLYLLATSEAGVTYGFDWLQSATSLKNCRGQNRGAFGSELRFANSTPFYDSASGMTPAAYWDRLSRRLRRVSATDGPEPTGKTVRYFEGRSVSIWRVTMTLTANDPFEYGNPRPIVQQLGEGTDPYAPGWTGAYDNTGYAYTEGDCPAAVWSPLYDPALPAPVAPPGPPDLYPAGINLPDTWTRRYVELPALAIPKWDEARPVVTITTGSEEVRNVRLRWYFAEDFTPGVDCGHIGVHLVTYIPPLTTFYLDAVQGAAYVTQDGRVRRSDSLAFGPMTEPVQWFGLSCNRPYIVVMDTPVGAPEVSLSISLTGRGR